MTENSRHIASGSKPRPSSLDISPARSASWTDSTQSTQASAGGKGRDDFHIGRADKPKEEQKGKGDSKGDAITEQRKKNSPYSVYSVGKRGLIVLAASLAGFFSPLSASIYYSALPVIAHDFHVSNSKVNLTVTTYLIIQGLAPMITAGFGDSAGRRPAYAICFIVYLAANLGLALQNGECPVVRR